MQSTSSIPKGVITDFTDIYCLVLAIQEKFIVVARERPNIVSQRNRGYFFVEYNDLFLEKFSIQYFTPKDSKPIKDVQFEIERHLGISVSNTEVNSRNQIRPLLEILCRYYYNIKT